MNFAAAGPGFPFTTRSRARLRPVARSAGRAATESRRSETFARPMRRRRAAAAQSAHASPVRVHGYGGSVNHAIVSPRSLADGEGLRALFAPLGFDAQPLVACASSSTYGLALQGRKAEHLVPPRRPAPLRTGSVRDAGLRGARAARAWVDACPSAGTSARCCPTPSIRATSCALERATRRAAI